MKSSPWEWTLEHGGAIERGHVMGVDPRDALARALTSDRGMEIARMHSIGLDALDGAPGNCVEKYELQYGGCKITVVRLPIWHYTVGHKLPLISTTGALLPSAVHAAPDELPVLWFSADQVYEPTAIKLVQLPGSLLPYRPTMAELHKLIGLFRFGLPANDARLTPWGAIQTRARISREDEQLLLHAGANVGATPENWNGTTVQVPLGELQMQTWDGSRWLDCTMGAAIGSIAHRLGTVVSTGPSTFGPEAVRRGGDRG